MKVKLKGSKQTQWHIGNKFLSGDTIHDLTEEELKIYPEVILEYLEPPKEEKIEKLVEPINEEPKSEIKKLSEQDIWDLTASEQKALIKQYGEKPASLEAERVKQILKLQVK